MDLAEFRSLYLSLAAVGCEWRAFELADPEQMAEQVFIRLGGRPLTLKELYKAIQAEVDDAYRNAASAKPLFAVFTGSGHVPRKKQSEKTLQDLAADVLRALPQRITIPLQEAYWDRLTLPEQAELRRTTPEQLERLLDAARVTFQRRLAKAGPVIENADIPDLLIEIKPGTHQR